MTKYFCDVCGKETQPASFNLLHTIYTLDLSPAQLQMSLGLKRAVSRRVPVVTTKRYELCQDCKLKIAAAIDEGIEKIKVENVSEAVCEPEHNK